MQGHLRSENRLSRLYGSGVYATATSSVGGSRAQVRAPR